MTEQSAQLPLAMRLNDGATFDNFLTGGNALVVNELRHLQQRGDRFIYLYGSYGSGRSHLLQACCHDFEQRQLRPIYLPLASLADFPPGDVLDAVEHSDLVCLDDIDTVMAKPAWEQALFGLFNALWQREAQLLVSAAVAPRGLNCQLADLQSRLSWGSAYQLKSLEDEAGAIALLKFRAGKRGMTISDEVAQFIYRRLRRDSHSLIAAVDQLDRASLAARRRITVPFVRQILSEE